MAGSGTAGWLDGVGTSTQFSAPMSGFGDASGSLFIAEPGTNRIRQMTSAGHTILCVAFAKCAFLKLYTMLCCAVLIRIGDDLCWVWIRGAGRWHWLGSVILLARGLFH